MIFKLYDCDVGVTIRGVNYNFPHVVSVVVDDPERNRLTRGANAGNKIGIAYKEGLRDPKTLTTVLEDIPKEVRDLLVECFDTQERIDLFVAARSDGSSRIGKNCVLGQPPRQLTLDDSAESMDVSLEFATYDLAETHKS